MPRVSQHRVEVVFETTSGQLIDLVKLFGVTELEASSSYECFTVRIKGCSDFLNNVAGSLSVEKSPPGIRTGIRVDTFRDSPDVDFEPVYAKARRPIRRKEKHASRSHD